MSHHEPIDEVVGDSARPNSLLLAFTIVNYTCQVVNNLRKRQLNMLLRLVEIFKVVFLTDILMPQVVFILLKPGNDSLNHLERCKIRILNRVDVLRQHKVAYKC